MREKKLIAPKHVREKKPIAPKQVREKKHIASKQVREKYISGLLVIYAGLEDGRGVSLDERSVRLYWGIREVTKKAKTSPRQSVPNSKCPEKVT